MNNKKINKIEPTSSKVITNNMIKIFILILIFFVICCILIVINNTNKKNILSQQESSSTYLDTKQLLEEKGFVFESQTIDNNNFTYFSNNIITISAFIETDTYKFLLEYLDKNVGNKTCGITDTSINTTEERKEQFNSYINWKKEVGLNDEQIKEVLLEYYLENNNKQ